jgi:hypothetical protein
VADESTLSDPTVEEDLYPADETERSMMVEQVLRNLNSAESWRRQHETRWERFYKLVHSWVDLNTVQGSAVFIPMIRTIIATIMPRILAQLPKPIVEPVEESDIEGARKMEQMLLWSADQSKLWLEAVKAGFSKLYYGTGILKITPTKDSITRRRRIPVLEPVTAAQDVPMMDPDTGQPMTDLNGQPMFSTDQVPMIDLMTGEPQMREAVDARGRPRMQTVEDEITFYLGPKAEYVSVFDLYVDPLASGFEDAEYVIQRAFMSRTQVEAELRSGYFRIPPDYARDEDGFSREFVEAFEASSRRLVESRGLGGGSASSDYDRRAEIHECWYRDGRVITILNRKWVVRAVRHPYKHGRMPYIRDVDDLNPGEFWGSGEAEALEGLQDLLNVIWNQQVDEIRLRLSPPILISQEALSDLRELRWGPGATISVNTSDLPLDQVVSPANLGDIISSAATMQEAIMRMIERVSAVSGYNTGVDSPGMADTATGTAIIAEQGNTRFSFKVQISELTGYQELYRQYAALLQQFVPEGFTMRIAGPGGSYEWKKVDAAALYGAFDFKVETQSSTQTESVRRQQAMDFFTIARDTLDPLTQQPVFNLMHAAENLLRSWGIKDIEASMAAPAALPPAPPGTVVPGAEGAPPITAPVGEGAYA